MSESVAFDVNSESLTADQWAALRNQQVRGEITEAPKVETPAAEEAKPPEGQEPSKEAEQEQKGPERDEAGRFKAKEKVEFNAEQQAAFDKAFSRREAKLRREYEARIAELSKKGTEPVKTETSNAPPKRPELPKLSEYKGTLEEFEKEVAEYPAKLAAYLDIERKQSEQKSSIERRNKESEARALKTHPDYKEEFEALTKDIENNDEPKLPDHVIKAIAEESDDPHELTYHLAKNREEFRRFADLSPAQALREVIKLDAKLALQAQVQKDPPAQEKKQAAPKPAPPAPVGARAASVAFDVNDDKTDGATWLKERWKQVQNR